MTSEPREIISAVTVTKGPHGASGTSLTANGRKANASPSPAEAPHFGLTTQQAEELHAQHGYNEVKPKQTPEWQKIAWRYLDWVSLVIIAAAVVSAAVPVDGDRGWTSFTLLVIELNLIVWVGYFTDKNAGNAIKELQELSAPHALVRRDGEWVELAVRELVPGDLVALKGGDVVPADCRLVGPGEPMKIDESSLTGESLAVTRRPGDKVLSGSVVAQGELEAEVESIGGETFFGRTMALLGVPDERGHLQKVLGRVSAGLGILAAAGVLAIFIVILARSLGVGYAFQFCFVILVSVVPIGMPVVTAAVLAVGAREMVKEKAIVSRLSALEELSGMEVLCSDKTGTLTLNRLSLDPADVLPWAGGSAQDVLLMASLSANWGTGQDAIDRAVTAAVGGEKAAIAAWTIHRLVPFNPVDKKTLAEVTSPQGQTLSTAKGAPQIIAALLSDQAAKDATDKYIAERATRGLRSLGVARSLDGGTSWELVGLISLLDPPRPDSADTIKLARSLGVEVKMVTGDQHAIAVETSRRLGMGTNIVDGSELMAGGLDESLTGRCNDADGFAGVYPEHKFRIVEALQARDRLIGMTGDGVNDAPALKRANVGIAVAGATAAAKGAADIILTEEGIGTIITAIIRSRKIFARLQTYIIYRMASSLIILGFFFFSIIILRLDFPTWVLVIISLTNDLSVMATSFDKVHSSEQPETWNMTKCLTAAFGIASVAVGTLVLLLVLADPARANWWPGWFNTTLDPETDPTVQTNGQTVAVMYMALTSFIQLSILLTRNPSFWWRFGPHSAPRPSVILLLPVVAFLIGSLFFAVYWPRDVQPDGGTAVLEGAGWVPIVVALAYVVVWLQVADLVKVVVLKVFKTHTRTKEHCHEKGLPLPTWVKIIDGPANAADTLSDWVEDAVQGMVFACVHPFRKAARRRAPKREEVERVNVTRLSFRDEHGDLPEDHPRRGAAHGQQHEWPAATAVEEESWVVPMAHPGATLSPAGPAATGAGGGSQQGVQMHSMRGASAV